MKLSNLAICVAAAAQLYSISASAETVNLVEGPKTVIESVAPLGQALTYVSGGNELTGVANTWPSTATPATAMNAYDHTWLNYNPAIIMQSATALNKVFAIPGVDHDFDQYESLEFIIWGSNSATPASWEEGTISKIYRDGFDTDNTTNVGKSDNYTSLWNFSTNYTFFKITAGNHMVDANGNPFYQDSEGEIDSLAAATPIPAAIWLFGSALAGLVGVSRRKAGSEVLSA
jgi:hypothetical protein